MTNVSVEFLNNPWIIAWKCARGKWSIDSIIPVLREFLEKNIDSKEYVCALEFLKVFKQEAGEDKVLLLSQKVFSEKLLEKIISDLNARNIVGVFKRDYNKAMGLLTLLEYLAKVVEASKIADIIKEVFLMILDDIDCKGYSTYKDLVESIVSGPLTSLPTDYSVYVLELLANSENTEEIVKLKASILEIISATYPPKEYLRNKRLLEIITKLMNNVIDYSTKLLDKEKEIALRLYTGFNTAYSLIRHSCLETGFIDVCKYIDEKISGSLNRLTSKVKRFET